MGGLRYAAWMSRSELMWRRATSLAVAAATLGFVWLAFAVITLYVLAHQPGPNNPSFGWFVLYRVTPLLLMGVVFVLMWSAWRLWQPWSRRQTPAFAAGCSTVILFAAGMIVTLSRG